MHIHINAGEDVGVITAGFLTAAQGIPDREQVPGQPVVTSIPNIVTVCVQLVRIANYWTVVAGVSNSITVCICLVSIG